MRAFLSRRSLPARWAILLILSAALAEALTALHLSAALLIGPMAAAVLLSAFDAPAPVSPLGFQAAQAILGIMIARSLQLSLLHEIGTSWPLFLFALTSLLAAACAVGWVLTRWRVLPGTTALWGAFPGAATIMVLMAGDFGADMRLVAFMQYFRVVLVALLAAGVARAFHASGAGSDASVVPTLAWDAVATTLEVAGLGWGLGLLLRLPAAPLLGAMGLGTALQAAGWLDIELPAALLALAYAFVGWSIGARFSGDTLAHVAHALPRVTGALLVLVLGCAGLAIVLVVVGGVDPLTAYLAMSPGGADTVAIIAAASPKVDMPFVMALQISRFLVVLAIGPSLARFIAKKAGGDRTEAQA